MLACFVIQRAGYWKTCNYILLYNFHLHSRRALQNLNVAIYSDAYLWPGSGQLLPPVHRLVVAALKFLSITAILIWRVSSDICSLRYNQERDTRDNIADSVPKPPSPLKGCPDKIVSDKTLVNMVYHYRPTQSGELLPNMQEKVESRNCSFQVFRTQPLPKSLK